MVDLSRPTPIRSDTLIEPRPPACRRPAQRLFSRSSESALSQGSHQIGHDYFCPEFERTLALGDRRGRQELELKYDGIAVLTLVALTLDLGRYVDGLHKQARFNEMLGAHANAADSARKFSACSLTERSIPRRVTDNAV